MVMIITIYIKKKQYIMIKMIKNLIFGTTNKDIMTRNDRIGYGGAGV